MSYTVFARKYRPQTFDDVVGQEHITRTLKNAILQNRLAHAYLFVGPRGTGKTSTARILAKALNCLRSKEPTVDPCGECDSCREIAAGNSLDVLEFDAASNTQVEKVREIIIENVKFLPARGRFKVYLVDEVHMLSTGSFNALLKTLEEPPPHVKFLFATTDVQKLPATILSRCQRFDLKRIGAPVIAGHLLQIATQEGVQLSEEGAMSIAVGADGGMRDAESMLDQLVAFCGGAIGEEEVLSVFGFSSRQKVSDLCQAVLAEDSQAALAIIHEQVEAGRDLSQLLSGLIIHLRNLLLVQADPKTVAHELGEELVSVLQQQCLGVDRERLLELIEMLGSAEQRMRWAANKQMHMEVAVLRAIHAVAQVTLTDVIETLAAIREGREPRKPSSPIKAVATPLPRAKKMQPRMEANLPKVRDEAVPAMGAPAPRSNSQIALDQHSSETVDLSTARKSTMVRGEDEIKGRRSEEMEVPYHSEASSIPQREAPVGPVDLEPLGAYEGDVSADVSKVEETESILSRETPLDSDVNGVEDLESSEVSVKEMWARLVKTVRERRPLISAWLESGALLSVGEGGATIGFPLDQGLAEEYIRKENNRSYLGGLLTEIRGRETRVECVRKDGVVLSPVAREVVPDPQPARDPMEEFKDDPLIEKALELFQARLESV